MKFTKIILGTLLATLALQTASLNAVLISSSILGPLEKVVCLLGEDHGTKNEATAQQLQDLQKLISSLNPKDICVITEAPDLQFDLDQSKKFDGDLSIVNQIARFCESKKIETHKIDFRKIINQKKEIVSIRSSIDQVTIKEFVDAIDNQFAVIDPVDKNLMSKPFAVIDPVDKNLMSKPWRDFFEKLKQASKNEEFVDKTAEYFFTHCTDIRSDYAAQLTAELIDARIKAEIQKTKAKIVFVVVGHIHAYYIAKELQQTGQYHEIFAQKAPEEVILPATIAPISDDVLKNLNIDIQEFNNNFLKLLNQKEEPSSSSKDLDEKKSISSEGPVVKKHKP